VEVAHPADPTLTYLACAVGLVHPRRSYTRVICWSHFRVEGGTSMCSLLGLDITF
jgi:hypothetical protein